MIAPKDQWLDREAGPVVRPYAVTKGRTLPTAGTAVGLIDVVVTVGNAQPQPASGWAPSTGRSSPGAASP